MNVKLIKKGRHELFNNSADIRREVFSHITGYLQQKQRRDGNICRTAVLT